MVIGLVVLAVAGTRVIDTRGEVGIDNFSLAPLSKIYWPEPTYYRNISLRSAASLQLQNDKKSTNGSHSRHFT